MKPPQLKQLDKSRTRQGNTAEAPRLRPPPHLVGCSFLGTVVNPRLMLLVLCLCGAFGADQPAHATDLLWIGGTGDWTLAGNWSPAQVPTSVDNVFITNNGTYTVSLPAGSTAAAGSLTVGGVSGLQTLSLDRTTLTLSGSSVVNPNGQIELLVSKSLITGSGDLAVNGHLNWINGTLSGSGLINIGTSGSLAIGIAGVTLSRGLNNSGSVIWGGGNLTLSSGVVFNNQGSGTFEISADGHLSGTAATINNLGLVRLTGGSTGSLITAPFNNSGTVQVQAATLSLDLGGTHNGTMSTAPGASLVLGGGNHVLTASSLVTGGGTVSLNASGASLSASGTFDPAGSSFSITAGTATLNPGCNVTGTALSIVGNGGLVLFNSAGSVGSLNLAAGVLGGNSPVNVTGPLTLSGGTITNALVTASGGLTINGNFTINGGKLVNPGTALWSAGNFTGANGAVISNLLGATFINSFDGNAASGNGATPVFYNSGLFQKTGGTINQGATSIDFQFINDGVVEVRSNILRYAFNQQTAGLTLLNGGGLTAQAQPVQLLGGSLVGTGLVSVANNQTVLNSARFSPGLPLGQLDIVGNYQQTPAGILDIELGGSTAGTGFDLVSVSLNATLAGTLNVSLTNGFAPAKGATLTFLTAATRAGAFSTFNYPSNEIGLELSYSPTGATLKVTNLRPSVANPIASPAAVTYGSSFNFQFSADTFLDPDGDPITYAAFNTPSGIVFDANTRTFSGTPSQTGTFSVDVVATDNGSPALSTTNSFTITVEPAVLTVVANPASKLYGMPDPPLLYTVDGFKLSDSSTTVLTGNLSRLAGEAVGGSPYAIIQGTLAANSNYSIAFTGSSFSIDPIPLTVTAESKTKVYGASDPAFTVTYTGFVNGESPAVLGGTLALARAPGENVGSYLITPSGLTSSNYTITFATGNFNITAAALSVTAESKTKVYGASDPAFTVSYTGFVSGENSAVLGGTLAFARAPGENVGSYLITPSGLTSSNYTITFATGNLSITAAALTVTADSKTKVYGASDPAFTVSYTGFVNGESSAVLGGTLALSRAPGENVGSYLITPSGLTTSNYTITFATGDLNITPAALTITADSKTKVYGASDPAFTVTYSGLVNGESSAVLNGTLALARAPGENVGSYLITPSGLTSSNYTISFATGNLSITPTALTVTADSKTKVYGASDPAFTVSYTGFVNGESSAVLGGTLAYTRAPGENVGTYLITPSGLTSSNYTMTFLAGSLTITAPPPVILWLLDFSPAELLLTWSAATNATYRVQFKTDLSGTQWQDLVGDVTAVADTASKADVKTPTNRFYRVMVVN